MPLMQVACHNTLFRPYERKMMRDMILPPCLRRDISVAVAYIIYASILLPHTPSAFAYSRDIFGRLSFWALTISILHMTTIITRGIYMNAIGFREMARPA